MKRRTVLGIAGSAASLGVIGYANRPPADDVAVRFWLSETAAEYDGVSERIADYLERALELPFWTVDVSYGGAVAVSTEDGYEATVGGEWPTTVLGSVAGIGDVDPVADANLLVTDGGMTEAPTGAGIPHVASVGGARHLGSLPPAADRPEIVPYTNADRVMQIVVHEVGHALGLDHEHGVAYRREDALVATPMLSAYAWSDEYDGEKSHCGTAHAEPDGLERALTYSFSQCARDRLREYTGPVEF